MYVNCKIAFFNLKISLVLKSEFRRLILRIEKLLLIDYY